MPDKSIWEIPRTIRVRSEVEKIEFGPFVIRTEVHKVPARPIVIDVSEERARKIMFESAWYELEAWRKRYAELDELADVFAAIDEARAA